MCVCVCVIDSGIALWRVCVCERERGCVCVCACVIGREFSKGALQQPVPGVAARSPECAKGVTAGEGVGRVASATAAWHQSVRGLPWAGLVWCMCATSCRCKPSCAPYRGAIAAVRRSRESYRLPVLVDLKRRSKNKNGDDLLIGATSFCTAS